MLPSPSFRAGLRDGALVAVAVLSFGAAFGVLAVQAGFSAWLAVLASAVIVSGAAQFAMLGLLPDGPGAVLVAVTGLALRHVPMSATLSGLIGEQTPLVRARLAFVLTDETFGLTHGASRRAVDDLAAYKTAADLLLYSGWVAGTATGAVAGALLDPSALGLGVLFALVFLGLAAPLIRARPDWITAGLAVVAGVAATWVLSPPWRVTGAAAVAALAGSLSRGSGRD